MKIYDVITLTGLVSAALLSQPRFAGAVEPRQADEVDCGTAALYYLVNIEARPRTLAEVRAALPPRDDRGYSFDELTHSAKQLGIEVSGARSLDLDHAPDRPIIAFLKRPEHGHYVLLRPVGHTGKLVQVLDGRELPETLDLAVFQAEQGWTGLCLIPRRLAPSGRLPLAVAIVVTGGWAAGWIWRRSRANHANPR